MLICPLAYAEPPITPRSLNILGISDIVGGLCDASDVLRAPLVDVSG